MTTLCERYGPWALVAGAGAGLGEAYARHLADAGFDLLVVDRDAAALEAVTTSLGPSVQARPVVTDLADPDALDAVAAGADDIDLGLVVLNAASSHVGWFRTQPEPSIEAQVRVNVLTPTVLVHRLLPRLTARARAGVILMSSQSSRRGAPLVATYAATKAYLAVLAESLWDELRDEGVDVLGVLPGSTRTPGWLASLPQSGLGTATLMEPDEVVAEALDALGTGVPTVVTGASNRESEDLLASMARADAVAMVGEVMREMYPEQRARDDRL